MMIMGHESEAYWYPNELLAIDAIVVHELHSGGIDDHGLLVIADYEAGIEALRPGHWFSSADGRGDLAAYFEHFT